MKYVDACVMRKLHYHAGTLLKMGTPGNYRQPVTTLALPKVPELTSVNVPRDQSHRFLEGEMQSDLWFEGGNCAAAFFLGGGGVLKLNRAQNQNMSAAAGVPYQTEIL